MSVLLTWLLTGFFQGAAPVLEPTAAPNALTLIPCPVPTSFLVDGNDNHDPLPLGLPSPRRSANSEAVEANRRGGEHYRAHALGAAETAYRQAIALDPNFFTPRLHLAAVMSRQERYPEAFALLVPLIEDGYVPWMREIETTADLVVLRSLPEWERLVAMRDKAALRWGRGAVRGLFLLARTGQPLGTGAPLTPDGPPEEQVFVLAPRQEIFSFRPDTGGWQQVTAEDGRVLGFAEAPDGHTLLYARAEKLVRRTGRPNGLLGLSLRLLRVNTMQLGKPVVVAGHSSAPGAITGLTLGFVLQGGAALPWVSVQRAAQGGVVTTSYLVRDTTLLPWHGAKPQHLVSVFGAARVVPARGRFVAHFADPEGTGHNIMCYFNYEEQVHAGIPVLRLYGIRSGVMGKTNYKPPALLRVPDGVGRFSLPIP